MTGPPMTNSLISFVFVRIQFMRLVVVLIHLNNFEKTQLEIDVETRHYLVQNVE